MENLNPNKPENREREPSYEVNLNEAQSKELRDLLDVVKIKANDIDDPYGLISHPRTKEELEKIKESNKRLAEITHEKVKQTLLDKFLKKKA